MFQIDFCFVDGEPTRIYICSSDGFFRVLTFDGQLFRLIDQYQGHTDFVKSIKVIPEKNIIVTGCRDAGIKVWDYYDHSFVAQLTKHKDQVVCLAYHPHNPNQLVSASWDQAINIYDLSGLAALREVAAAKLKEMDEAMNGHIKQGQSLRDSWNNSRWGADKVAGKQL
jgi:WD40 repeat protein